MESKDRSSNKPDMLEGGPPVSLLARPALVALGVVAAVLIGVLVGYSVGHHTSPTPLPEPAASSTPATAPARSTVPATPLALGIPLVQTGATCSSQYRQQLQLGIQVRNQSSSIVSITGVDGSTQGQGLRVAAARVGTCGEITDQPVSMDSSAVLPGAGTWLTVTVSVLVTCPAPYPVQFTVHYVGRGRVARTEPLTGFVDLSHVPYSGCATSP